jgi:undecaprenyl-diphosphatase
MEKRRDLVLLVGLLFAVLLAWGFFAIADAVRDGDTVRLDERLLRALHRADDPSRPVGHPMVEEVARDLTALGSTVVLALLTFSVAGWLALSGSPRAAAFVVVAVVGGATLSALLKLGFDRPRPDVVPHLQYVPTSSFPSGHTMVSSVVYFTLGALVAQFAKVRRLKVFPIVIAAVVAFSVGASRVFLGVHYPTDVLAGWAAGIAWSVVAWLVLRRLLRTPYLEGAG